MHQRFQHLRIQLPDLLLMGNCEDQSPHRRGSQRSAAPWHQIIFFQELTNMRFVIVVMFLFDALRQSL